MKTLQNFWQFYSNIGRLPPTHLAVITRRPRNTNFLLFTCYRKCAFHSHVC